jgi:hypothetical protein
MLAHAGTACRFAQLSHLIRFLRVVRPPVNASTKLFSDDRIQD